MWPDVGLVRFPRRGCQGNSEVGGGSETQVQNECEELVIDQWHANSKITMHR